MSVFAQPECERIGGEKFKAVGRAIDEFIDYASQHPFPPAEIARMLRQVASTIVAAADAYEARVKPAEIAPGVLTYPVRR